MSPGALSVVQLLPALNVGGVERGTLEVAKELVKHGHRSIVISAGGRMRRQPLPAGGVGALRVQRGRRRGAVTASGGRV